MNTVFLASRHPLFDGLTIVPEFDEARLTGQWLRVYSVMKHGDWLTLGEIQGYIHMKFQKHDSEAAISARLRDFRKEKFGAHTVDRQRRGDPKSGLFEYRLTVNK